MALNARIHANNPSNAANTPHVLAHDTPRTQAGDKLLDVRNGTAEAASKFSVDKDGKVSAGEIAASALGFAAGGGRLVLVGRFTGVYPAGTGGHSWGVSPAFGFQAGDVVLVAGRGGNVYSGQMLDATSLFVQRAVVGDNTDAGRTIDAVILRFG